MRSFFSAFNKYYSSRRLTYSGGFEYRTIGELSTSQIASEPPIASASRVLAHAMLARQCYGFAR